LCCFHGGERQNVTKLERRIGELEAQREREYDAFLRSLSDDQLQFALDGLRAAIRGEPISDAAMAVLSRRPIPPHRELTPAELTEVDRFVRGETT
jgi:hypothetical protein